MAEQEIAVDLDGLEEVLKQKAQDLVAALEQGKLPQAIELINQLQTARHEVFYNEVGHLTRGLHEAIKSFSSDVGGKLEQGGDAMSDASDRLAYVIELTEETAHKTMDRVDQSLGLVDRLDSYSGRFRDLLMLVGQLEGEFEALNGVYDRTCQLKDESEKTVDELRTALTDILVSQGFQDITGQLIRRVITLLTQVESQLVKLMDMASKVERLSGIEAGTPSRPQASARTVLNDKKSKESSEVEAEGPQVPKGGSSLACDQDDVDELLSSLGF
ncbi:Chemotaxis response - phosphatase CheZ [Marinobacterium lacunae]|uniref:Protein phosphatase CheZ n=1 Tax=Marinobacterium lacunae TaxID=1232683 RepID=A0A081G0H9_9GAMM|nr:protein phosphatase CheZ [Marinobacterium lacunae]KEA64284.1 Chemotaxis response - phosphatase CheZ [Marinobacterium lacunae]